MITDRLYYDDAYLTEFDARVAAVREGWAALDRSAFYPTSGGQPFDTGALTAEDRVIHVTDVEVEDGVVWHRVDRPLRVGEPVHGKIDWARRFDHMQQHAGDHMLAGAAWELFGGVTIGLHLGKESSTIDMTLPGGRTRLTDSECGQLETLVNRRVQQDDLIRCWFPSPEELKTLPLRKQPTVAEHVRVVAMGDYEMVPCGGTHPRSTGQIGPVKIISSTPARGKMRLCFVAGMRAAALFQQSFRCASGLAALLSSDMASAPEALKAKLEAAREEQKALADRLVQAAVQQLTREKQGSLYVGRVDFATRDLLLRAASLLTKAPDAVALLCCPAEAGVAVVFARGSDAPQDMAQLMRACGIRGGGKPAIAIGAAENETCLAKALEEVRS